MATYINGQLAGKVFVKTYAPRPADKGHTPVRVSTRADSRTLTIRASVVCECGKRFNSRAGLQRVLTVHANHAAKATSN